MQGSTHCIPPRLDIIIPPLLWPCADYYSCHLANKDFAQLLLPPLSFDHFFVPSPLSPKMGTLFISKMYFSHWKPPGVSERMWSVNLDASISGEYETRGGHSCRPSEEEGVPATSKRAPATGLGAPATAGGKPESTGNNSRSSSHHSRAVWDKHLIWKRLMCAWKWWSSELRDTLWGRERGKLVLHLQAIIEQVWRCTWRQWSSQCVDALGGHDRANLDAVIERVWRYTSRSWSCEFGDDGFGLYDGKS